MRNQLAKAYLERENLMGVFEQTKYTFKVVGAMSGEDLLGAGTQASPDRSIVETGIAEDWVASDTEPVPK